MRKFYLLHNNRLNLQFSKKRKNLLLGNAHDPLVFLTFYSLSFAEKFAPIQAFLEEKVSQNAQNGVISKKWKLEFG